MSRNPVTAFAESRTQEAIVRYLKLALPDTFIFFSVPNGGYQLPKSTAARLKREGLHPGVADLAIVRQGGFVCFLEVKTDKGELSPDQVAFSDWCGRNGVEYAIVRGVGDTEAFLLDLNVPLRARLAA